MKSVRIENYDRKSRKFQIDLKHFLISLAQGAMVGLGEAPDPETKRKTTNLEMVKYHLGVLQMLKRKTNGNLSDEEQNLINVLLEDVHGKLSVVMENT